MVQIGLGCNRNCKISQFTLFHDPRLLPFFSNPFELGVRKNIGQRRIGGRSDEVRGLRLAGRARKSGPPLGTQRARRLAKFRQNVARFRLYRLRFLQENMRFAAFFEIYQILKLKFLKFGKILQILPNFKNFRLIIW